MSIYGDARSTETEHAHHAMLTGPFETCSAPICVFARALTDLIHAAEGVLEIAPAGSDEACIYCDAVLTADTHDETCEWLRLWDMVATLETA